VVLVFPKYNRVAARNATKALIRIDIWLAIAFLVFVVWSVSNDFAPVGWVLHVLDEWRLSATSEGVGFFRGMVTAAFLALVTAAFLIVVFPAGAILTIFAAGYVVVFVVTEIRGFTTLLALPVFAASTLSGVVVRGVKGVLFFLSKPQSVREIKRTIKQQHKHRDAGAHVKKVLDREARRVLSRQHRWWRPTFIISSATRHNKILAKYLHSLAAVGDAAERPLENEERKKHD